MAQIFIHAGDKIVVDGWDQDIVLKLDRLDDGYAELTVNSLDGVSVKRGRGRSPNPRPEPEPAPKPEPVPEVDVQTALKSLAESVGSLLSELDAAAGQELLSQLVSDLFYAQARKRQKEERMVKQREGIAAAKARGVRFGRAYKPLPENFTEYCKAWRDGQMSLRKAAKACGMDHSSFQNAWNRMESAQ